MPDRPLRVSDAVNARRPLGATALDVSLVALGTMQFGWTVSDVEAMRILDAYREAGGNLVDTANMYGGDQSIESFEHNKAHVGVSEDTVGRWLESRNCRSSMVVTTKVRARMWDGPDGEGLCGAHIVRAVDDSLRRLRTDHVDVLYAHWPDPASDPEDWLATFGELIQSGKVGHVGTSNFCGFAGFGDLLSPLLAMAEKDTRYPRIEVEQPRYNLLNRAEYEDQLQSIAVSTGLGIVTYSSLASGFLSGAFRPDIEPVGERASQLRQYFTPSGWSLIETLDAIGARHEVPLASVALAWALAQPGVTSTIIGPDSIAQLAEASYAPAVKLDEGEISALNERSWDASAPEFVDW